MKERMRDLNDEKQRLTDNSTSSDLHEKLVLHPRMHELYLQKIAQLDALLSGNAAQAIEARELVRSMITKVNVSAPSNTEDYSAELYTDLVAIFNACGFDAAVPPEGPERPLGSSLPRDQLSVVAGARFELTTFRL